MKPSTVAELAGFACLVIAAAMIHVILGIATAGISLLFIGYATDDSVAGLSVARMIAPFQRRRLDRKTKRSIRRSNRRETRRPRPAEVVVNVKPV